MPKPDNPYRSGTQMFKLYEVLSCRGEVLNAEIVHDLRIFSYHAKLGRIREFLKSRGCDLVAERLSKNSGLWRYRIVQTEGLT